MKVSVRTGNSSLSQTSTWSIARMVRSFSSVHSVMPSKTAFNPRFSRTAKTFTRSSMPCASTGVRFHNRQLYPRYFTYTCPSNGDPTPSVLTPNVCVPYWK